MWLDLEDRLRAYPSPEWHEGTRRIEIAQRASVEILEAGDFDGDGIEDELSIDYFHMRPFGDRATSGMVRVRSGASGDLLLAHAVPSPLNQADWCGDLDDDGTDDVLIEDGSELFAFGRSSDD